MALKVFLKALKVRFVHRRCTICQPRVSRSKTLG